ncbi:NlpC/P60 family protein [Thermopolyspora sp. NPDC052614]|uniref:C40 family peptidase n=1 Tax=Thermopolyspora sp. NPDC052614 TaxID=3155682 RepID=UPI003426826A
MNTDPVSMPADRRASRSPRSRRSLGRMLVPLLPLLLAPLGVGASPAAAQAEQVSVKQGSVVRQGVPCSPGEFVALAPTPGGAGYWVAGADGEVTAFGDAPLYGTASTTGPSAPVVALVPSATGKGYWLVGRDGQVVSYGDAAKAAAGPSDASSAAPVVAAARAGTSGGLWLAAADGTVRARGGAALYGSAAGTGLSRPISAIVSSPSGKGYWLVAQDGRVLAFGDARPITGDAALPPSQPVVAATRAGNTHGLWLTTADGAVHARGDAPAPGAPAGSGQVIGITSTPTGSGYWQLTRDGAVLTHDAPFFGTAEPSCEADLRTAANARARLVPLAQSIMNGQAQPPWPGGAVPYSWGGGHGRVPGPSKGTCTGYTGSIRPCPADKTVGVDCSGLSRWVYRLAFGSDVLGAGNTNSQVRKLTRVTAANALPGDLVYFGTINSRTINTHHVGVYIGNGQMINAARTGTFVRVDKLAGRTVAGYYRYQPSAS